MGKNGTELICMIYWKVYVHICRIMIFFFIEFESDEMYTGTTLTRTILGKQHMFYGFPFEKLPLIK